MQEFNKEFGYNLAWLPWQRPGFELGMMLKKIVEETPNCDGVVLVGHGLFTWGNTQRENYLSTITIIDQLGQFTERHSSSADHKHFEGSVVEPHPDRANIALSIMRVLRGVVSRKQRWTGSFSDLPQVLQFVNSSQAQKLAHLGTSCPDHFIRTKIRPMFIHWNPSSDPSQLKELIETALETYHAEYYQRHALKDSPALRDASPTIVLAPGIGMFSFGKIRPNRASPESSTSTPSESCRVPVHSVQTSSATTSRKLAPPPPQTSSPSIRTTSLSLPARPSASNTGSSKKPRFVASRPRKSSAAWSLGWECGGYFTGAEGRD